MYDDNYIIRPPWLDYDFLIGCIKWSRNLKNGSTIYLHKILLDYAVPKGENYLSVIYRASVDFKTARNVKIDRESFIIKSVSNENKETTLPRVVFDKEIDMYTDKIPKVKNILRESELDEEFSCRFIKSVDADDLLVVLEDLKSRGYAVCDRLKGLDLDQCKLVLKKLAKLHAGSMCCFHDMESTFPSSYHTTPFERPENEDINSTLEEMSRRNAGLLVEAFSGDEKYRKAVDFLMTFSEVIEKIKIKGLLAYEPGNKFNVLNHGDCWSNNLMFKYDSQNTLEDVLFVDFQESNYSSAANDFNTFFFSSANQDVRNTGFRELQKFYFERLLSNLKRLEYAKELPTLEEFRVETRKRGLVVMNTMTLFFPLIFMVLDETAKSRTETKEMSLKEVEDLVHRNEPSLLYLDVCRSCVDVMLEENYFDHTALPL